MEQLLNQILASWQVQTLIGLITLDVLLGVAVGIRTGKFDWRKLTGFYRSMVVPYLLGYVALAISLVYILPTEALSGTGDYISQGMQTLAWAAIVAALGTSIKDNFTNIYNA